MVRMSSTRIDPLAGCDGEAAPELAPGAAIGVLHLLREDAPHAQLARDLEGEEHAPGRRADHDVHGRAPVRVPDDVREIAADLDDRLGVLEHLELLEVAVAVATALEQEVAVPKRAGRAEQRLHARGDRGGTMEDPPARVTVGGHGAFDGRLVGHGRTMPCGVQQVPVFAGGVTIRTVVDRRSPGRCPHARANRRASGERRQWGTRRLRNPIVFWWVSEPESQPPGDLVMEFRSVDTEDAALEQLSSLGR